MTDLVRSPVVAEAVRVVHTDEHDPWRLVDLYVQAFLTGIDNANTRRAYSRDLPAWVSWCQANGVDPLRARYVHARAWVSTLTGAEASKARRVAAVGAWYAFLGREDAVTRNPIRDLKRSERPRVERDYSPTVALSHDETTALLAAADADGARSAAIVYLLLYCGMRVGELLGATVANLTSDRGHPALQFAGKGRKERTAPLHPAANGRLQTYLAGRGIQNLPALPGQVSAGSSRPLIATKTGQPLRPNQVWLLLRRLGRAAGLGDTVINRLCPHGLRHTFATASLDQGAALKDVQDALGHADPRTTRRYDHSSLNPDRHPSYKFAAFVAGETPNHHR